MDLLLSLCDPWIFSAQSGRWHIADAETAALFAPCSTTLSKHGVEPGQLTLHADRGGPMKAKATALLLADLGVTKSHSRPYTSTTIRSPKAASRL